MLGVFSAALVGVTARYFQWLGAQVLDIQRKVTGTASDVKQLRVEVDDHETRLRGGGL
tara:strand:- start:413 stop:586 length:174 start_codon:yes stop_codon:yes gene_type:complete